MPVSVKINDGAISTTELFSGILFEIHPPQRRFKWKKPQVNQLWEDIRKAHIDNRESYFLGTLLLAPPLAPTSPGKLSVIDGQQRLTTLSLLLAVLRDLCREYPDLNTRADNIQRLISRVDDDGKPVGALVVTLQEADNGDYELLTKEPGSTNGILPGKGLLSSAVKLLKERVEQHINVPERQKSLQELCQYVQRKIKLLPLEVQSEGDGYLVFDTTNTRGLRLSPAEALKARLAAVARREDTEMSDDLIQKWDEVAGELEKKIEFTDPKIDAIDVMDDYLHAVWCSIEGYTAKGTIDRQISSKLTNHLQIRDFVADLSEHRDSYLAVRAPLEKSWLSEDLKDLKHLNKQSFSFLTMVHKHSPNRFQEAVSLVLSLQIRNITVGTHRPNAFEKDWPRWAKLIREGQTDQAFHEISNLTVSDEEFEIRFAGVEIISASTASHLLRRLDPISRPGSGVLPVNVDVEHVLPKSVVTKLTDDKHLSKNVKRWIKDLKHDIPESSEDKQDLGKKFKPYLNMLGNQALLNDKDNRGAKDLRFAGKQKLYEKQALELTRALAEHEEWGLSQIQARQQEMAKRAIRIWPK